MNYAFGSVLLSLRKFIAGPTSFAPVIDAAIDIVEKSNGQYHVLVIIADGQVCYVLSSVNCFISNRIMKLICAF